MPKYRHQIEAVDPNTGKLWLLSISDQRIQATAKRGRAATLELAYTVPFVLKNPTAIYEGLRHDDDEPTGRSELGWLCYVGLPECSYNLNGQEEDPYEDEVFLVFVTDEGVVYQWRWEKCSNHNVRLPIGEQDRFQRRLM